MTGPSVFDKNVEAYEQWFIDHPLVYVSELRAVRDLLPQSGSGFEVGVGTGRFAAPLGIKLGIEPSANMREVALRRGVTTLPAVAEKLPFKDREFDFALMVTTVCFLDDLALAFSEVSRVLKPGGAFIIGFVDRESPIGKEYLRRKEQSVFYKDATFYSVDEIAQQMRQAGFGSLIFRQTLFRRLDALEAPEPVKEGYGEGSFVAVRGISGK